MKDNFISVFWAWNGELNTERIENQLRTLADKGINNFFIHARAGLKAKYMGEEWMACFSAVLRVAKELGVYIWIYDENGWPSGFGGGKVFEEDDGYKQRYLLKRKCRSEELGVYGIKKADVVKVFSADGLYKEISLEKALKSHKEYYFIYIKTNEYYVDITNPEVTDCFLRVTHEKYKERFFEYFGNVIPGVFTDEPHIPTIGINCGKYVIKEYEERYGESFHTVLKYLFFRVGDYKSYRYKYRKLVCDLIRENYAGRYADWCRANGLLFTGHFACEEGLCGHAAAAGNLLPLYKEMGLIGVDALGNRLIPHIVYKQAQSIARQFGDGNVLCESYAGTGYDATFPELMRIWAYQAITGVTAPCLSISMLSLEGNRKRDYPQFFSEQAPWWERAEDLFSSINFVNNNLKGDGGDPVLVVLPMSGINCLFGDDVDDEMAAYSTSFRNLSEGLVSCQVDFDYGDEDEIKRSEVGGGTVKIGRRNYTAVIVPESENIESGVLEKLRSFALSGGKVFFCGKLPVRTDGMAKAPLIDFEYIPMMPRADHIRKVVQAYMSSETSVYDLSERKLCARLFLTKRRYENGETILALNPSRSDTVNCRIVTAGKKNCRKIGKNYSEPVFGRYGTADGVTEFPVALKPMEYCFFRLEKGEPSAVKYSLLRAETIKPREIKAGNNVFVIDKASVSTGADFDREEYVYDKTRRLYAAINGKGETTVKIRYRFETETRISPCYACLETGGGKVTVNDAEVLPIGKAFYSDADKFEISPYLKTGENVLILEKTLPPYYNEFLGKDVFQSVMNVFSFPFYIESVIVSGDFSVGADYVSVCETHVTTGARLVLRARECFRCGDLTEQGMFFFAGEAEGEYLLKVPYIAQKTLICYENTFAVAGELTVNGMVFPLEARGEAEVTAALKEGDNVVKLKLYSSLRNIFGPHHHVYGKHYYTGPAVFEGYTEWQDAVVYPELKGSTYRNEYSFVKLIVPALTVKVFAEEK